MNADKMCKHINPVVGPVAFARVQIHTGNSMPGLKTNMRKDHHSNTHLLIHVDHRQRNLPKFCDKRNESFKLLVERLRGDDNDDGDGKCSR